jgi:hypothetical protein
MRRAASLLAALAAAGALVVSPGAGFSVDPAHTFMPLISHGDSGAGVHELITRAAVKRALPSATPNLVTNLQFTTASTDFMHHFDGEYHFDSSSTKATPKGLRARFIDAFSNIRNHLRSAHDFAVGNAQFLKPTYRNLREIRAEVASVLGELSRRKDCTGCSSVRIKAHQLRLALVVPGLKVYPSPDPHPPTNPTSVLSPKAPGGCGLCGRLGTIGRDFPLIVNEVEAVATYANRAAASLPPRDALRRKAVRLFQAVRAYRGYFDLGHALHATQDFFTHANYVELMAGVEVGRPIGSSVPIPVPQRFDDFSLGGLRRVMGPERYARLETGAVTVFWLNEEDTCMDPGNAYNPGRQKRVLLAAGIATWLGILRSPFQIWGGRNPGPPAGLNYCHYATRTVKGLHKDTPAEVNHLPARKAAIEMSIVLLREFFTSIGAQPEPSTDVKLAGSWVGQDNGRFTVTQTAGSKLVAWVGCSADGGTTWQNTFTGSIEDGYLIGHFTDRAPGRLRNEGDLALEIVDEDKLVWVQSATVGGKTTSSFPTATRVWSRGLHSGCSGGGRGTTPPPAPPGGVTDTGVVPTAATCPPAFTMEVLQSLPPYAKTGEFDLTSPTIQRTYADSPLYFKCLYLHAQDRGEAFVIFFDIVPPNSPGRIASGDCARTSTNPYASEKRYVTVSGGERRSFTRAAGGNVAVLQRALELAEAQGVGHICPKS